MLRKHSEIKRGKTRIVINYKSVNTNTKFVGYYIPNKEILINLARGKNYYNKFDCKSRFWQIKMDKTVYLLQLLVHLEAIMNG